MNVMANTSSDRARREAALQRADIGAGFYNLVDGQRLATAQTLDVIDPGTGAFLAKVPDVDRSDLDTAVDAAARAFPSWSRTPWDVRKAAIGRLIEALGVQSSFESFLPFRLRSSRTKSSIVGVSTPLSFGHPRQHLAIGLAAVAAHDGSQRSVGLHR